MAKLTFDPRFVEIGYEAMMLGQYIAMVEANLAEIRDREKRRVWDGVDDSDDAEVQVAQHFEDRAEEGVTTRFLLGAAIVGAWALYESAVQELATYAARHRSIALTLSDVRGDLLQRARKYYRDVLGLPLHDPSVDWNRLEELALLRHVFAHANGELRNVREADRKRLRSLVQRTPGISLAEDRYLIVEASFARESLSFLRSLLDDLVNRVRAATRRVA